MDKLLTISEVSKILHVSYNTLRTWDEKGILSSIKTEGGHRRWRESDIEKFGGFETISNKKNIEGIAIYCRVSSHDQKQKGDLERQKGRLLQYCIDKKYDIKFVFDEVGSGMNDKRPKLRQLMKLSKDGKLNKIVVEHIDRLTRFNKDMFIEYFNSHGVSVEWTHEVLSDSFENELVKDMLSLIGSFSSKIYGRRSAERRKKNKETK